MDGTSVLIREEDFPTMWASTLHIILPIRPAPSGFARVGTESGPVELPFILSLAMLAGVSFLGVHCVAAGVVVLPMPFPAFEGLVPLSSPSNGGASVQEKACAGIAFHCMEAEMLLPIEEFQILEIIELHTSFVVDMLPLWDWAVVVLPYLSMESLPFPLEVTAAMVVALPEENLRCPVNGFNQFKFHTDDLSLMGIASYLIASERSIASTHPFVVRNLWSGVQTIERPLEKLRRITFALRLIRRQL